MGADAGGRRNRLAGCSRTRRRVRAEARRRERERGRPAGATGGRIPVSVAADGLARMGPRGSGRGFRTERGRGETKRCWRPSLGRPGARNSRGAGDNTAGQRVRTPSRTRAGTRVGSPRSTLRRRCLRGRRHGRAPGRVTGAGKTMKETVARCKAGRAATAGTSMPWAPRRAGAGPRPDRPRRHGETEERERCGPTGTRSRTRRRSRSNP